MHFDKHNHANLLKACIISTNQRPLKQIQIYKLNKTKNWLQWEYVTSNNSERGLANLKVYKLNKILFYWMQVYSYWVCCIKLINVFSHKIHSSRCRHKHINKKNIKLLSKIFIELKDFRVLTDDLRNFETFCFTLNSN